MATTDNNGISIYYEVIGSGRPLVLQHGFTMSTRRWHIDNYVAALEPHYQLILIDARGHGRSDKPHVPEAYGSDTMATDVLAVLKALDVDRFAYWGFSMGGSIGFELANLVPERVEAFVLSGMHPYGRKIPPAAQIGGDDPEAFAKAFMQRIGMDPAKVPAKYRDLMLDNDFRALAACQQDRDTQEAALAKMTMPVLMFAGSDDPMHDQAKQAAEQLPDGAFFTLEGLDHGATFRESHLALPRVQAFLESAYPS